MISLNSLSHFKWVIVTMWNLFSNLWLYPFSHFQQILIIHSCSNIKKLTFNWISAKTFDNEDSEATTVGRRQRDWVIDSDNGRRWWQLRTCGRRLTVWEDQTVSTKMKLVTIILDRGLRQRDSISPYFLCVLKTYPPLWVSIQDINIWRLALAVSRDEDKMF